MKSANTDLIGGATVLALTALFWANRGSAGSLSISFPNTILLIMLVLSLVLLVKAFVRPDRDAVFTDLHLPRVLVVTASLFVWIFAMRPLGFFVTTVLVFGFLVVFLARATRRVGAADVALWMVGVVLEVGVLYLVFTRVLYVPLPKGLFF